MSDMEFSSGEEGAIGSSSINQPTKDGIQKGDDFIRFNSDSETDADPKALYTAPEAMKRQAKNNYNDNNFNNNSTGGRGSKRKRHDDDDDDINNDLMGPTGPPPGCPWMGHRHYSALPTAQRMMTQELKDFVQYISPTREEHQVRRYVFRVVQDLVKSIWHNAEVRVFGSFDTQLYLPTSDLDLVVLADQNLGKNALYKLSAKLRAEDIGTQIEVIRKAKVPLVKFKERITGFACDVSFDIKSGISSSSVVKDYMREWKVLRPMVLMIKYFLMLKGHNEVYNGGLGSYTTMLMILSFLQMHPQIQKGAIDPEDNLGVLMIEFFELYGKCYNYSVVGLKVRDGGSYFVKEPVNPIARGGDLMLFSIDPNDSTNNTARGSFQMRRVRELFVGAFGSLSYSLLERVRILRKSSNGQRKHRDRPNFDNHNRVPADSVQKSSGLHRFQEVSLIKDVFGVPNHILQHRAHIRDVFYSGTFQRKFGDPLGINGLDQMEGIDVQERTSPTPRKDPYKAISTSPSPSPTTSQEEPEEPEEPWITEDEDQFLANDVDANTPSEELSKKLAAICKPEALKDPESLERLWLARRKVIRLLTQRRIVAAEAVQGRNMHQSERNRLYAMTRATVDAHLDQLLRAKEESDRKKIEEAARAVNEGSISFKGAAAAAAAALASVPSSTPVNSSTASLRTIAQPRMTPKEVVYIDIDSDDDDELGDKHFSALMAQGAKEYQISDDEEDEKKGDHNNPANVNTSGDYIQLPQLLAAVLKPTKPEPHTGLIDANACLNFVENQEEYFEIVELNKNKWVKLHDLKVLMVPFDLTNAPAAFSNTMRNVLYPLLDVCVAVYLDDILIYSDNKTDHLKHIRRDRVSSKPP
ncbi:hypothetical protein BGZ74_004184 [Mortierella antarctica]|nr:hypothetical protein BGZ74_004184 [Mortierella antarctica]